MFTLLTMLMTGGGSATLGSLLKGVFGGIADSREQKHQRKMAYALRDNENAIKFQKELMGNAEDSKYVRATRRMLALICVSTLCAIALLCTIYPTVPLVTLSNIDGTGTRDFLWGFISLPARQTPMVVTTGHIALFEAVVVFPMILGFYFTPGGRR
jgi:hypothetical protein